MCSLVLRSFAHGFVWGTLPYLIGRRRCGAVIIIFNLLLTPIAAAVREGCNKQSVSRQCEERECEEERKEVN